VDSVWPDRSFEPKTSRGEGLDLGGVDSVRIRGTRYMNPSVIERYGKGVGGRFVLQAVSVHFFHQREHVVDHREVLGFEFG
jgi:hypothetical protein